MFSERNIWSFIHSISCCTMWIFFTTILGYLIFSCINRMFFEWKNLNIRRLGMFFEWKHLNYTTPFKKKYWKSDRKHEKNNAGLSNWYQYQGYCIILVDMVKKEVKNYSKITIFTVINVFPQASGPLLLNQGEDRNPTIIQEELRGMQHATLPATRFFPSCFSLAMCVCVNVDVGGDFVKMDSCDRACWKIFCVHQWKVSAL